MAYAAANNADFQRHAHKAEQIFTALKNNGDANALLNLAMLYFRQGLGAEAREAAAEFVACDPVSPISAELQRVFDLP